MAPLLRILSLDGGGIRGVSSLQILQGLMEKIREVRGLAEVPRPCDIFDLIGGTSTGGIIAIMLGRLGMTVDECIKTYKTIARRAFTPKFRLPFPAPPTGSFSAAALERAIKDVIQAQCKDNRCASSQTCSHKDLLFRDDTCTKTVVLATTKENVNSKPTLFRTYDKTTSFQDCSIWEIARATSAATTFFKSIKCGRDNIEFIDAALGYNNPCEVMIEEAKKLFPEFSKNQIRIVSIGTGLGDVVTIQDSRTSIIRALKTITTTSKKTSERLAEMYGDSKLYYRFNVDRGLEDVTLADWKASSRISAHTHNYLRENESYIFSCAESLFHEIDDITGAINVDKQKTSKTTKEPNKNKKDTSKNQVSIHRNRASHNAEQHNTIIPLGIFRTVGISDNISSDGSIQWNSIRS
ncbi:FabD/lysophospholipase-like protein [Rostrohypoxylon terebratum]|nr:FabD/lysophospholipase-like protein [Rostrohypoxylon terebratum]